MRTLFTTLFALLLATAATAQTSAHVFILMLENRSDAEAMRYMPYLSGITSQYGRGLQAYSPSHGSFNAYLEVVAGSHPQNGQSDNGNCNGDNCQQPYDHDSMVRELNSMGMTWRGYFQSMPSRGYMGYSHGDYVKRHNPYAYLADVVNDPNQQQNMLPWTSNFAHDLLVGNVADYTWLVPDLTHDGHNPTGDTETALRNADAYLAQQLPFLLRSRYFQPGGDGILLVTFDESDLSGDNSCNQYQAQGCGGHIFFTMVGPGANRNYQSPAQIMQADMLRGTCDLLGVPTCPGDGAPASGLRQYFAPIAEAITAPNDYFPHAGSYTNLNVTASSTNGPIVAWAVYVDGHLYARAIGSPTLQMWVGTPMGSHVIGVNAWDITGAVAVSHVHITRTF